VSANYSQPLSRRVADLADCARELLAVRGKADKVRIVGDVVVVGCVLEESEKIILAAHWRVFLLMKAHGFEE